jgi:hypothetical protein
VPYISPNPIRLESCAAKIETTYGTDPVPTAASNAVRLSDRLFSGLIPSAEWPNLRDDAATGTYIPLAAAAAHGQKAKLVLQWEIKGLGSAYTSSTFTDADPLIQACGWAGTFGASQWTYAPVVTTARPSCTVYGWGNGNQYKVSGCRGNFEAMILAGRICQMRFTLEGILTALPLAASVPATTYTAVVPPAAVSQTCTIGPWTPDYDQIVIRTGNDVQWLYSGNATDGLQSYDFGLSRPEIEVTARAISQATYDPFTDWTVPTSRAFTCTLGSVANNKMVFSDTGIWIPSEPTHQNQKNFTGWQVKYRCLAPQVIFQ